MFLDLLPFWGVFLRADVCIYLFSTQRMEHQSTEQGTFCPWLLIHNEKSLFTVLLRFIKFLTKPALLNASYICNECFV